MSKAINSLNLLAPVMERLVRDLLDALNPDGKLQWMVFETYRGPLRQYEMLSKGASKVGPMQSAHQYGLAADLVPLESGKPVWPKWDDPRWDTLDVAAEAVGLVRPIKWDRPHIEHPSWVSFRELIR